MRNAVPLTKTELQTAQEKAISSLDVFVFRDGLLEAHGRSTGATVTGLEVTHGEKTIWAFVNYSVERMNAVTSLATATSFATQYAENGRSAFCMRGYDTFTVSSSATSFNMDVRRDVSKVEIAAAPQFTGLAAGGTLEGIYLINIPKVYSNSAVSTSSSDSLNFDNAVATAVDPQVSALSSATGASSWQTALYGMPNTTAEAATVDAKDYVTKLVLKATVQGQSYWYPIGIPDMGANKLYSISNIAIRRIGADNPNDYISAEDIDITINVLDWETGEVTGSYNGAVIADPANGHPYVDLGIRVGGNKILFATMNIGASSETDYGDYFAWGETSKRYTSISGDRIIGGNFDLESYLYSPSGDWLFTKYSGDDDQYAASGTADGLTILELEDDAANVLWGGSWRIPSIEEMCLLYESALPGEDPAVDYEWVYNYNDSGINGVKIIGKADNPYGDFSSATLFLPATGYIDLMNIVSLGSQGNYWLRTLDSIVENARNLQISYTPAIEGDDPTGHYYTTSIKEWPQSRPLGVTIRPVLVIPE